MAVGGIVNVACAVGYLLFFVVGSDKSLLSFVFSKVSFPSLPPIGVDASFICVSVLPLQMLTPSVSKWLPLLSVC